MIEFYASLVDIILTSVIGNQKRRVPTEGRPYESLNVRDF